MAMTKEQRIELLKLAREAKAKKAKERKDLGEVPVKKTRAKKAVPPTSSPPNEEMETIAENSDNSFDDMVMTPYTLVPKPKATKSVKTPTRSLNLNIEKEESNIDEEVITEEIVEVRKKPKKKVVKKIVYESNSEDEIEETIVEKKPKKKAQSVSSTKASQSFFNY